MYSRGALDVGPPAASPHRPRIEVRIIMIIVAIVMIVIVIVTVIVIPTISLSHLIDYLLTHIQTCIHT